jgi:hypothetical protein
MYWHADEIEWMWEMFPRKYAECRVFALLYGLTKNGKGWNGSNARMAARLHVSAEGIRKILDELEQMHLIVRSGDHIHTIYEPDNNSVDADTNPVDDDVNSVDDTSNPVAAKVNSVASLSPAPPITKNKKSASEMTTDTTFENYKSLFLAAHPDKKTWDAYCANAERRWNDMEEPDKRFILTQLQAGEETNDNPYFLLKDWKMPQPKWLTGMEHDSYLRAGKIVCICRDDSNPRNPRMRPIELSEALRHQIPCKRWELLDAQKQPRSFDHIVGDSIDLPVAEPIK